jgi:hypothetical protein
MLGSVGALTFGWGGDQLVSIGGLDVLAAGVPPPGVDGVGVVGRGTKQPVILNTRLNTRRAIMMRFIVNFLR